MGKLLVPIQIEAVIENRFNEDDKRIGHVLPEFNKLLETGLGDNIEAKPFSRDNPLEAGIHLHFILPDALTHGVETKDGFQYPDIPNRWLVTRTIKEVSDVNPMIKRTCWIVESDYIGLDNTRGAPMPALDDKDMPYRFLGRCYPLNSPEKAGTYLENLTVFGAGDPAFASFYPSCRSVLGFHDPLTDCSNGMLAYSVIGWYAEPQKDPLYQTNRQQFSMLMEEYGWDCKPITGEIPQTVLCHGMVFGLEWKGDSYLYPSGIPSGGTIDVTAGNTSQEALSALISNKMNLGDSDVERFLNTLQYDILDWLDEKDGPARIEDEIHKRAFTVEKAGYLWRLTAKPSQASDNSKPRIPEHGKALLIKLNEAQKKCNQYVRKKKGLLEELFYIWHTYLLKYENPPSPRRDKKPFRQDIFNRFQLISEQTDKNDAELSAIISEVEQAKQKLEEYIDISKTECIVEKIADKDYTKPNSPVLLFSGDGLKRSFLFGESGRFQDGKLLCREDTDTVRQCKIPLSRQEVVLELCDLISYFEEVKQPSLLPDCYEALFLESMLLDGNSARFLSIAACQKARLPYSKNELDALTETVRQQILAPWDGLTSHSTDVQTLANQLSFEGLIPSKIAVNFWTPPFHTLFLEWDMLYLPTQTDKNAGDFMDGWGFEGADYTYKKGAPTTNSAPSFSGRTVVTPHSQYILKDVVQKQIERYKEKEDFKELLEKITGSLEKLTLLSQNLGGFTEQLISLKPSLRFPFFLADSNLWEDENAISMTVRLNELINPINGTESIELNTPMDTESFFPIRSGFLKPLNVVLLDTFGRSQLLKSSLDDLYVAESLRPHEAVSGAENMAMLPPRISQEGRFQLEYVPVEEASPVIGFIVPNLLNRGLMIYGPDGTMLGSLHLAYCEGGQHRVIWRSTPLILPLEFEDVEFPNEALKSFAGSLKGEEKSEDTALEELLYYIDRRQCQILQEGGTNQQDISVLCGRPIVLFQARITMETMGMPAVRRSMESFGGEISDGFEDVPFHFEIGDMKRKSDGFIGYYDMTQRIPDYRHLHPCSGTLADLPQGYIDPAGQFELDLKKNNCKEMLCLAEPPGGITVKTGIYPVETINIPEDFYTDAIKNMYMAFEVNPIISQEDRIAVPFCESAGGRWSWAYRTKAGYKEREGIAPCLDAFDEKVNCIMDGFLIRRNDEEEPDEG